MGQVTLKLNGYSHTIACKDGEEEHLRAMGEVVEQRLGVVRQVAGTGNESRMLVMAALLMADDIYELEKRVPRGNGAPTTMPDAKVGRRLAKIARRAEDIAARLEQP